MDQFVDPSTVQHALPESFWFVLAVISISAFLWLFREFVSNLKATLKELKESSARHAIRLEVTENRLDSNDESIKTIQKALFKVRYE